MDITMKSKASNVTASCVAHLDIKLWRIFFFFFLSSVTNWRNKYINVLSHYLTSVALCFSDSKKGQWRPDSPSAVYQWKSNIVHKQGSGNQYFITKLLVKMKKNSRSFLAASSVRVAVSSMSGPWRAGLGGAGLDSWTKAFVLQGQQQQQHSHVTVWSLPLPWPAPSSPGDVCRAALLRFVHPQWARTHEHGWNSGSTAMQGSAEALPGHWAPYSAFPPCSLNLELLPAAMLQNPHGELDISVPTQNLMAPLFLCYSALCGTSPALKSIFQWAFSILQLLKVLSDSSCGATAAQRQKGIVLFNFKMWV